MNYADLLASQRDVLYCIAALDQNGAASPTRIHRFHEREIGPISPDTISHILSKLTNEGVVSKKRSESDGRKRLYFLDQAGRQALVQAHRNRAAWLGLDVGTPKLAGQAIQPREVSSVESD